MKSSLTLIGTLVFFMAASHPAVAHTIIKPASSDEFFLTLMNGLNLENTIVDKQLPRHVQSKRSDVHSFLHRFPFKSNSVTEELSFEKKYRYIQANYDNFFLVFRFGTQSDKWDNKLYAMSFTITHANKEILWYETRVFQELLELYGDFTKEEKFRYYDGRESEELDIYLWTLLNAVVTYRSYYSNDDDKTIIVVDYWDKNFYTDHNYYDH